MPRWVRALVIVGAALIVLLFIALLASSEHGPGRHGAIGPSVTPAEVAERGRAEA